METIRILRPIHVSACNIRTKKGAKAHKDRLIDPGIYPVIEHFISMGMATHGDKCISIQVKDCVVSFRTSDNKPITQGEIDAKIQNEKECMSLFADNPTIYEISKARYEYWMKIKPSQDNTGSALCRFLENADLPQD